MRVATRLNILNPEQYAILQFRLAWITLLLFVLYGLVIWKQAQGHRSRLVSLYVPLLSFGLSLYFMLFGFIRKSVFTLGFSLKYSDTLYIPLLLMPVIIWMRHRPKDESELSVNKPIRETWKRWALILGGLAAIIVIITLLSIHSHDGLGNYHERF